MIRPLTIIVIMIGGLISAAGVVVGVLTAPEGGGVNWLPFGIGIAVGSLVELGGVAMLLADQRASREAEKREAERENSRRR